jgi:dynein assembly factor 1
VPRLNKKFIDQLLCSNFRLYYRTHELNECLYLHFKGFKKLENLDTFINLKVLYLEGNSIKKIENLSCLKNLCSLYLHENLIEKIEGLDELKELYNLNLSDNCLTKIENLENLPKLSNLLLKRNRIGINGLSDLEGLKNLSPSVTVIDISDNRIETPEILPDVLTHCIDLRVLYLNGNECIRKIAHYRKMTISTLKDLRYLDDRPVFDDERRFAEAFFVGGLENERKERGIYKKEKEAEELKRIKDFQELVGKWKGENKENENSLNNNEEEGNNVEVSQEESEKRKKETREKLLNKCFNKAEKAKVEKSIFVDIKEEKIDENEFINTITTNNTDNMKKMDIADDTIITDNNNNFDINTISNYNEDTKIESNQEENDVMPTLEEVKTKKESGYIEYMIEKERYEQEQQEFNQSKNHSQNQYKNEKKILVNDKIWDELD